VKAGFFSLVLLEPLVMPKGLFRRL